MTTATGDQLRAAEVAHRRLIQGHYADAYLQQTTHDALRGVAERTHTLKVPQIQDALKRLQARD